MIAPNEFPPFAAPARRWNRRATVTKPWRADGHSPSGFAPVARGFQPRAMFKELKKDNAMNETSPIYVDNRRFLGRVREQKAFRAILDEVRYEHDDEAWPYVILIYGDGGMGKTTLSKRLRDIAMIEQPYEGEFQSLWIDWEEERRRWVELQVGREFIAPETVYDIIHSVAVRNHGGRHFKDYQKALKQRKEAEQVVAQAFGGELGETLAPLRGLSATAIARLVRMHAPVIGNTGEQWVQAAADVGLKVTVEQAAQLYGATRQYLKARMSPELYDIYLNPRERLAQALARGLRSLARSKRLIFVQDTYEIVDVVDFPFMRDVIKAGGPRILWVLSGRNNLARSRSYGQDHFIGYEAEFQPRLLAFDLPELALADVQTYFADYAPERPLSAEDARLISRATRGIPLAIKVAAEMWSKGASVVEIVGEEGEKPAREIVGQMTGRYLLHTVRNQRDRLALYALALARGDRDLLLAMLRPEEDVFDLNAELKRLERLYASVHLDEARLHDEPAVFISDFLRQPNHRLDPAVQRLHRRAVDALRHRISDLEEELPAIEERCEDEDWVGDQLRLVDHAFALDEREGWRALIPRFVEGLAYSSALCRGLLQVAASWREQMSRRGRKRLKALQEKVPVSTNSENKRDPLAVLEAILAEAMDKSKGTEAMLDALNQVKSWLAGGGEEERLAILAWQWGELMRQNKQYAAALDAYQAADRLLPSKCERLSKRLAESLYKLSSAMMWPDNRRSSVMSDLGLEAIEIAVRRDPANGAAWYNYGVALDDHHRIEEALMAHQQAIAIEPRATRYNGLGNVYSALGQYEDAIASYQQAIALDPKYAYPHNNLADIYFEQRQFDLARHHYQERIRLSPEDALNAYVGLAIIDYSQESESWRSNCERALSVWDKAWQMRLQSEAGLLENKALVYLLLGEQEKVLNLLMESLQVMTPGESIEFYRYEVLAASPQSPEGLEACIELLRGRQAG